MHELLRTGQVDAVGELLRSATFVGDGFGCYSTFEVRDDATEWSDEQRIEFWRAIESDPADEESEEELRFLADSGSGYSFTIDGLTVHCCWYWDGDGTLAYRVLDGDTVLRAVINHDCKKSHCWQEIDRRDCRHDWEQHWSEDYYDDYEKLLTAQEQGTPRYFYCHRCHTQVVASSSAEATRLALELAG